MYMMTSPDFRRNSTRVLISKTVCKTGNLMFKRFTIIIHSNIWTLDRVELRAVKRFIGASVIEVMSRGPGPPAHTHSWYQRRYQGTLDSMAHVRGTSRYHRSIDLWTANTVLFVRNSLENLILFHLNDRQFLIIDILLFFVVIEVIN